MKSSSVVSFLRNVTVSWEKCSTPIRIEALFMTVCSPHGPFRTSLKGTLPSGHCGIEERECPDERSLVEAAATNGFQLRGAEIGGGPRPIGFLGRRLPM